MTATTPANLPALVRRQWDREDDCFHALAWAEWLEEHRQPDRGELVRLLHEGRHALDCDCTRCRRSRELRAKLSAWPCGACRGKGCWADGPLCPTCDGTGDVLVGSNGDAHFQFPLEWDCGYPRRVTLPTIDDAVAGLPGFMPEWLPTPRLRALAQTPPWGVPLDGVRVADRGPYKIAGSAMPTRPWVWDFNSRDGSLAPHCLPRFLLPYFDDGKPEGFDNGLRYYPTGQAAADALARGLATFAREYK